MEGFGLIEGDSPICFKNELVNKNRMIKNLMLSTFGKIINRLNSNRTCTTENIQIKFNRFERLCFGRRIMEIWWKHRFDYCFWS